MNSFMTIKVGILASASLLTCQSAFAGGHWPCQDQPGGCQWPQSAINEGANAQADDICPEKSGSPCEGQYVGNSCISYQNTPGSCKFMPETAGLGVCMCYPN